MNKVIQFFSGKKAYLVGLLMIILGALQGDMTIILEGAGVMALRAGIAKQTQE